MIIKPKNWDSFQHYKDRSPNWIKLHRALLNDFGFSRLPLASKALAPLLWILASEYPGGAINASLDEIAFRIHVTLEDIEAGLQPLIDAGFFICKADQPEISTPEPSVKQDASNSLAEPEHDASELVHSATLEKRREREREEGEKKETRASALPDDWPTDFREQFWKLYPNKVGKPKALAKLERVAKRAVHVPWAEIMDGLERYIRSKPPDRPWLNPETFINQERWADQPANTSDGHAATQNRPGGLIAAIDRQLARLEAEEGAPSTDFALPANDFYRIPDGSISRS